MDRANFKQILMIMIGAAVLSWDSLSIAEEMAQPAAEEMAPPAAEEAAKPAMMDEAMMAKWQEYSTPNENHRVLDQIVGDWDYTSKMWMAPEAAPEETSGTSHNAWIMGGRFVEQVVMGKHMGQDFEGRSTIGYDNAKKEYISTWFDSMGTGMMVSAGSYDAATKTLTQQGSFHCPLKGQMSFRWLTKVIDEDTYVFEGYTNDDAGQEYKSMEITYKRK